MRFTNIKKRRRSKPFFSVITVVKNDEKNILKTINSIKKQTFKNFEYIIVDGNSSDRTLNKIKIHKDIIDKIISEKDNGIYFAMNKGVKISSGSVIVFVNSGDILFKKALEFVYNKFYIKNLDFLFGTVRRNYTKTSILKYGYNLNKITYSFDFATSHSTGFFLRKKYYKEIDYFNTEYKCSADYDVYYKLFNKKNTLKGDYTTKKQLIGEVASGGFSSKYGFLNILLEECKIRLNNGQNILVVLIILINKLIKDFLKKTLKVYNVKEINQKNSK